MTKKIGFGNKDFGSLDWDSLVNLKAKDAATAEDMLITFRQNYVLPQLMAWIASPEIKLERTADNKVSATETLKSLSEKLQDGSITFPMGQVVTKPDFIGILNFLTYPSRKSILPVGAKQVSPEWRRFSQAVPLFLSAFKEFRNLKYSEWDFSDPWLDQIVDKDWSLALAYAGTAFGWDENTLLTYQDTALTYKTGDKAGTQKHKNQGTSVGKVGDSEFDALPKLVKLVLCQLWLWQECNTTKLGIYNITDVDAAIVPLGGVALLTRPVVAAKGEIMEVNSVW